MRSVVHELTSLWHFCLLRPSDGYFRPKPLSLFFETLWLRNNTHEPQSTLPSPNLFSGFFSFFCGLFVSRCSIPKISTQRPAFTWWHEFVFKVFPPTPSESDWDESEILEDATEQASGCVSSDTVCIREQWFPISLKCTRFISLAGEYHKPALCTAGLTWKCFLW